MIIMTGSATPRWEESLVDIIMASSRNCNQSGEGCTVTFSKTSALYRGQSSRFSIRTSIAGGPVGRAAFTGSRSDLPVTEATSRAMP